MTEQQSSRGRRHARTRQVILDAAQELIAELGPEKFSLRTLAERIEYSPASLYEYFSGKEEILNACCGEGLALLKTYLLRVPTGLTATERTALTGAAYLQFAREHRELYLLMFGKTGSDPQSLKGADSDAAYQQLKSVITVGIDSGEFQTRAGFGLDEMAYLCWTVVHGMAMLRLTYLQEAGDTIDALNQRVLGEMVTSLRPR
ncbi:TetR/AcrR family transcriptional regulator [Ktedonospora formicarum]|uniref:HTH tetR-type domain-containing protein n=1 Tax=Ktedonospora formicarum TaxID=2778364 RepID=A0A8J3I8D4_9CHLR|nr:TetR/AcrR family transcriptional regulator [Ktedonospora formicarum]GHO47917.1 hypothetical protein KSX_60800 [Ktedonospora formicarum]